MTVMRRGNETMLGHHLMTLYLIRVYHLSVRKDTSPHAPVAQWIEHRSPKPGA